MDVIISLMIGFTTAKICDIFDIYADMSNIL